MPIQDLRFPDLPHFVPAFTPSLRLLAHCGMLNGIASLPPSTSLARHMNPSLIFISSAFSVPFFHEKDL